MGLPMNLRLKDGHCSNVETSKWHSNMQQTSGRILWVQIQRCFSNVDPWTIPALGCLSRHPGPLKKWKVGWAFEDFLCSRVTVLNATERGYRVTQMVNNMMKYIYTHGWQLHYIAWHCITVCSLMLCYIIAHITLHYVTLHYTTFLYEVKPLRENNFLNWQLLTF